MRTGKWPITYITMLISNMVPELAFLSKPSITVWALKWPFTGMDWDMPVKTCFYFESMLTIREYVPSLPTLGGLFCRSADHRFSGLLCDTEILLLQYCERHWR